MDDNDVIFKLRVINLTQGGLKAMEELAQLERERGNPADGTAKGGVETVDGKKGNRGALPAMGCAHS